MENFIFALNATIPVFFDDLTWFFSAKNPFFK